jgi:hypothetical protein
VIGFASPFRDFNPAIDGGSEASSNFSVLVDASRGHAVAATPAATPLALMNRRREIMNAPRWKK